MPQDYLSMNVRKIKNVSDSNKERRVVHEAGVEKRTSLQERASSQVEGMYCEYS